ncbi:MAG TPA: cupin [Rhodobiaceae bacterium]|nr:cupin [Rhodobiaceae bacterium]
MRPADLEKNPVHLGPGGKAVVQPRFTGGIDWYMAYGDRHDTDGVEGRLVSMFTFTAPWESWAMHPAGDEIVLCISGHMVLHQELPEGVHKVGLGPGQYAVNPSGVWHTADVEEAATALFITTGLGTEHRPR